MNDPAVWIPSEWRLMCWGCAEYSNSNTEEWVDLSLEWRHQWARRIECEDVIHTTPNGEWNTPYWLLTSAHKVVVMLGHMTAHFHADAADIVLSYCVYTDWDALPVCTPWVRTALDEDQEEGDPGREE